MFMGQEVYGKILCLGVECRIGGCPKFASNKVLLLAGCKLEFGHQSKSNSRGSTKGGQHWDF